MNNQLGMSQDDLDIATLRYRAPGLVPLEDGRVAVVTPGWPDPHVVCGTLETAWQVAADYVRWNVLGDRKARPVIKRIARNGPDYEAQSFIEGLLNG